MTSPTLPDDEIILIGAGSRIVTDSSRSERNISSMKIKGSILFIMLLVLDQLTKYQALTGLKGKPPIVLVPGILELTYVENRGAAFGILQNKMVFFFLMTAIILAGILWVLRRLTGKRRFRPLKVTLIVLASGAVGNLIDRIIRTYVVDFIYFKPIDFPVFNVADIYVTVSAAVLVLLLLFYYKDHELEAILGRERK